MEIRNNLKKLGLNIPYYFFMNLLGFTTAYLIIFFIKIFYPKDRILCNIFWNSVGHLSSEFDFFFLKLAKLKKPIKVIVFCPNSKNNQTILKKNKKFYRLIFFNYFLFKYISLISPKFKKNFIDCSLSDLRFHFQKLVDKKSYIEVARSLNKYYILKKKTKLLPFLEFSYDDDNLSNFLQTNCIQKKKYAVIHIKEFEGNACAKRTSPDTYLDTIHYLNSLGLKVVFGGRERMPAIFKELNVINFANSNFSKTYEDDLNLIANSCFVISFASGYMFMPDVLNIPGVSVGSWNLADTIFSRNIVILPTILNYENGEKLTFKNQHKLFIENINDFSKVKNINPINPTGLEILSSVKQALNRNNVKKSDYFLEARFKNQFKKSPIYYSQCRISEQFLQNNIDRF
jgi:putative glycosyltransferase (TIGR04372 family)